MTDADGRPLLHLRFIGEGAFGLAEFTRVQSFSMPTSRAWFLDGYRIVPHLPDLRPLRDVLANSSREDAKAWLAKSMAILRATESPPIATVSGCAGDTQVGEHICQTLQNLQTRIGGLFPEPPVWLPNLSAPMFSGSRKTIRSALSHAFGYWHWQVGANGTLHRFHLEANWGGLSWPELEIAAFLLEHRLGPEVLAAMIVSGVVESTQEKAVIASLPAATQLWLQGCLRELRQLTPTGAALWREDLFSLWAVLSQYSDLLKYHGISV